jgi:hypothetical protein
MASRLATHRTFQFSMTRRLAISSRALKTCVPAEDVNAAVALHGLVEQPDNFRHLSQIAWMVNTSPPAAWTVFTVSSAAAFLASLL